MKNILLLIFIFSSYYFYSQKKVIVFDTTGRITKTFGEENGSSFNMPGKDLKHKNNKMVIENVYKKDKNKYYLIYQVRQNDYLYQSNLTAFDYKVVQGKLNGNCVFFNIPKIGRNKILSYQLVKTNRWGSNPKKFKKMIAQPDWKGFYLNSIRIDSLFSGFVSENMQNVKIDSLKSFLRLKKQYSKKVTELDAKEYPTNCLAFQKLIAANEKLNAKVSALEIELGKLSGLARTENVVEYIDLTTEKIIATKLLIIDNINDQKEFKKKNTDTLSNLKKLLEKSKTDIKYNEMESEFFNSNPELSYVKEPVFDILHQGTMIQTDSRVGEIIYDLHSSNIFDSNEKSMVLKRQTPNLPQLTTDDILYTKIINVPANDLSNNPLFIQLNIDVKTKATADELLNGPDVKGLDKVDDVIPVITNDVASYLKLFKTKSSFWNSNSINESFNSLNFDTTYTKPAILKWASTVSETSDTSVSLTVRFIKDLQKLQPSITELKFENEDLEKLNTAKTKIENLKSACVLKFNQFADQKIQLATFNYFQYCVVKDTLSIYNESVRTDLGFTAAENTKVSQLTTLINSSKPTIKTNLISGLNGFVNNTSLSYRELKSGIDSLNNLILRHVDEFDFTVAENLQLNLIKEKIKTLSQLLEGITGSIVKELSIADTKGARYFDYLLKYDKEFPYLSKPSIELKAIAPSYTNYERKFEKGEDLKANYTVKKELTTFAKDELSPVRKRYWFNINAGVIYTPMVNYEYIKQPVGGSQTSFFLEEKKSTINRFAPTLFFSTYIGPNDIYEKINKHNWYNKIHIDVGVDYYDKNLLDNVYLGLGFEPIRSVHFVGGLRMGNVTYLDLSKVDPVSLDVTGAQKTKLLCAPYIGVNLGFNLIPMAIKTLLNK